MTCAEARRQLPGPDSPTSLAVEEHLRGCNPCRSEAEALREVDRRLQRLGALRLLSTTEQILHLDRQLAPLRGETVVRVRPRRWLAPAGVLGLLGIVLALCLLLAGWRG